MKTWQYIVIIILMFMSFATGSGMGQSVGYAAGFDWGYECAGHDESWNRTADMKTFCDSNTILPPNATTYDRTERVINELAAFMEAEGYNVDREGYMDYIFGSEKYDRKNSNTRGIQSDMKSRHVDVAWEAI